jgi:hypothetical protein
MKRVATCLLALALTAHGAEWEFATRKNDRRFAFVKMRGTGAGGACEATLVFSRAGAAQRKLVTKDNATTPPISIELWLTDSKQAKPFKLEDYEGPDAPIGGAKFVTVALTTKGKAHTWKWPASGWFSPLRDPTGGSEVFRSEGEPEAFVFGLGDAFTGYRDLLQVADSLAAGADSFTIDLAGRGKSPAKLHFEVPVPGATDALKQLLAPKR